MTPQTPSKEIHISDLRTFLQCRRQWSWSSPLRDGLEPKISYAPFFTGRAVHQSLQRYYEQGPSRGTPEGKVPKDYLFEFLQDNTPDLDSMWDQERDTFVSQVELIQVMLEHYALWVAKDQGLWSDANLDFVALETEFSVPLRTSKGKPSRTVHLAGRMDGLVRRKDNGTYWLLETKTSRSPKQLMRNLDNDIQAGGYLLAAREIFDVGGISGVLYNILRKKEPVTPRLLQDGMLSKAVSQDTTPEWYLRTIRETHPEMDNSDIIQLYGDILKDFMPKRADFFVRHPVRRTQSELDTLASDLLYISLEMAKPNVRTYPTPAWNTCNYCKFKAPCLALNAGADYQAILEQEYQPRVYWDPLEAKDSNNGSED